MELVVRQILHVDLTRSYDAQHSPPTSVGEAIAQSELHAFASQRPELDWIENFLDEQGTLDAIPENLRYHFNYESYLRELKYGGEIGFTEYNGTVYAFWS